MTTEQQTEPGATEEPTEAQASVEPDEETKKLANDQLRNWADSLKGQVDELKPMAMRSALSEIGLSPDEGLGVAIVEAFDGKITDEAVAQFALEKYKYDSGKAQATEATQAADATERLQTQGQSVTPTPEPTEGEQAASKVDGNDPEAGRGEAAQSLVAKLDQFNREHYGNKQ